MRIAILDDYQNAALAAADWKGLGKGIQITVFNKHIKGEAAVAKALKPFDVVVGMRERTPFPKSLIGKLPNLKLLITTGMRNLSFDLRAAKARGVVVCGTSMLGYPAAEHAAALIFALYKKIPAEDRVMKKGGWQASASEGMKGKTLGILGLGKLGARVARVGQALEMNVVAWSQNLTAERCREAGATLVTKEELLRQSDFVTLHVQLSPRTEGMIGAAELALMKPTAYLINTSRGQVVDEAALLAALRENKIAGAGIDVYDVEPLPLDHPFRKLANAVTTPHLGYATLDNFKLFYQGMLADIRAWLDGKPISVMTPR